MRPQKMRCIRRLVQPSLLTNDSRTEAAHVWWPVMGFVEFPASHLLSGIYSLPFGPYK